MLALNIQIKGVQFYIYFLIDLSLTI